MSTPRRRICADCCARPASVEPTQTPPVITPPQGPLHSTRSTRLSELARRPEAFAASPRRHVGKSSKRSDLASVERTSTLPRDSCRRCGKAGFGGSTHQPPLPPQWRAQARMRRGGPEQVLDGGGVGGSAHSLPNQPARPPTPQLCT